jgi:hypothetical protein
MTAPAFFVPNVPEEKQEETFAGLAKFAGAAVPPLDGRVWRIEWVHDGERWTGEVGKQMHGEKIPGRRSKPRAWVEKVSDPATVLAIFPDVPWFVVTDKAPIGTARSAWENPFMAGRPARFDYFSPPT